MFIYVLPYRWSRKADTQDVKDHPISLNGKTYVAFAIGAQDYFYQHSQTISGYIDFTSGQATWPVTAV
tara:strand:+ start:132 stop:335 length:204 start_codon:yes stop_codon:yes gene_type:complete